VEAYIGTFLLVQYPKPKCLKSGKLQPSDHLLKSLTSALVVLLDQNIS